MNAEQYMMHLQLQPHPEGGYYRQSYRSTEFIPGESLPVRFNGKRPFSTAIYYLLEKGDYSSFHKIKSDECWHFYAGGSLYIHVIENEGNYTFIKLGNNIDNDEVLQYIVHAGAWFAVEPAPETIFALTGCTVAPGFDFEDFEMGDRANLVRLFPQYETILQRMCREKI